MRVYNKNAKEKEVTMFTLIISGVIVIVLGYFLYNQYQINQLPKFSEEKLGEWSEKNHAVVDLRDFNVSYKTPINGAYNIPSAYLKRYYKELPTQQNLLLVTSDPKYVGPDALFLKRRGLQVAGIVDVQHAEKALMGCKSY